MRAYCYFCETRRCREIAKQIEQKLGYRCFSPQIVQRKWVKGTATEEYHDWLPGYIFLYSDAPVDRRFDIKGILRCLGNDELKGRDYEFAEMLYRRDGIMGIIRLAEVGDFCKINDPAWEGIQGRIIKMDRGRKRCCVEYEFDGITRTVWVGYEMVDPCSSVSEQLPDHSNRKD